MTEPWERGENLSICHRRSRAPGFFLEIDGSPPLFEMPPILPLCPFLSSAVHLFGHLDNLYSSSLPTRSLNDKSHGHWKSTLAKVTASLAEPPSPLPPTPPWGPAWGSRLFETPQSSNQSKNSARCHRSTHHIPPRHPYRSNFNWSPVYFVGLNLLYAKIWSRNLKCCSKFWFIQSMYLRYIIRSQIW